MTKEKVMEILNVVLKTERAYQYRKEEVNEAFDIAIKALEQQSSEDCISREEAIRIAEQGQIQGYEWQFKKLCDLSSVTPQQNTGHWFIDERPESDRELVCSNCDQPIFKYHKLEFDYRPKYCPNCGAKMKSEDKNE